MGYDTYSLYDYLLKNSIDRLYIWISEQNNGKNDLMDSNNTVYLSDNGWYGGVIKSKIIMTRRPK